jgi:hypothetical protein
MIGPDPEFCLWILYSKTRPRNFVRVLACCLFMNDLSDWNEAQRWNGWNDFDGSDERVNDLNGA